MVYFYQVHKKLGQTHLALMNFSWAMDLDPKGANNQFKEAIDPAINRFPSDDDDDTTNNNPHDNGTSIQSRKDILLSTKDHKYLLRMISPTAERATFKIFLYKIFTCYGTKLIVLVVFQGVSRVHWQQGSHHRNPSSWNPNV